ncbi:DASH complex subunit dam1 [Ascosphaera pollenicola]|nr:DASH complex subunit dam1 [Ascosphaera pollenicola]
MGSSTAGAKALALLCLASLALAHGDDMAADTTAAASSTATSMAMAASATQSSQPDSYFTYPEYSGVIWGHIVSMTLAWFFILPVGVMLSIARSRHTLPVQFLFLVFNAFGVFLSVIYNASTPDLYPNNAHHKMGWIATWTVSAEALISLLFAYSGRPGSKNSPGSHARSRSERIAFLPVPTTSIDDSDARPLRWSADVTAPDSPTSSHSGDQESFHSEDFDDNEEKLIEHAGEGRIGRLLRLTRVDNFLSSRVPKLMSHRMMATLNVIYIVIERAILPFGFAVIATGAVTYGGIFHGHNIFNGLAHFIKGGIFFWYGVLTTGRWIGCFADFGWAWNIKPSRALVGKWRARVPTAEFTESFVIFLYGITNVFLEHLAGWGGAWAPEDLEHVSISILFLGGGICGMLIESKRVRQWMNMGVYHNTPVYLQNTHEFEPEAFEPPKSQRVSLNPIPALIILMLGLMMSSHHQHSMISTMIHTQWGMMLAAFSVARIFTYIILCLNPPRSLLPYRPPTEVIASFCLMLRQS